MRQRPGLQLGMPPAGTTIVSRERGAFLDVFQNTSLAQSLGGDEISIRESHIRPQN